MSGALTKFFQRDPPTNDSCMPRTSAFARSLLDEDCAVCLSCHVRQVPLVHRQWHYSRTPPLQSPMRVSPLVSLSQYQEIWHSICWLLPGNSLMCLANVSSFRQATRLSPAFVFLSGRDLEGFVIPWADPSNVLASSYKGWNPDFHFSVRMGGGLGSCMHRHAMATQLLWNVDPQRAPLDLFGRSICGLSELHTLSERQRDFNCPNNQSWHSGYECGPGPMRRKGYHFGGPARPPSPLLSLCPCSFTYVLPNPNEAAVLDRASPVLFPERAHAQERAKCLKRDFAEPEDSSSDEYDD